MLLRVETELPSGLLPADVISVILPTISGREGSLARIVAAYEDTLRDTEHELIVVKDQPTWPAACNKGYAKSKGDILHFTADDLEPLPGWQVRALEWLESHDELPAAKVLNFSADGEFDNAQDGADGAITWFTRVPIMRRDQYERIGSWPEIIYLADIWLSEKAHALGIETRLIYSYAFIHHWSQIGRVDSPQNLSKSWQELNLLRGMYAT